MITISLDGVWQIECFNTEDEAIRGENRIESVSAHVPGDVHLDLFAAGIIEEPFRSLNAEKCQWVSDRFWVYKKSFTLGDAQAVDANEIIFDGLDTYATVLLNGKELGKTANMFIEHRFDVSGIVRAGDNELVVRLLSPHSREVSKNPQNYPAAFDSERLFDRKMQCSYGWDWAPRIVNVGIWRSVRLESAKKAHIEDVFAKVVSLEPKLAKVEVDVENRANGCEVVVSINDAEGDLVAQAKAEAYNKQTLMLEVENPKYWWPNGSGEQYLYSVNVSLQSQEEEIDSKSVRIGMRTIEIDARPDERGSGFVFRVNGQRRFMKGANWIPSDSFPAAMNRQRYREILRLARDANINMLRVWGGGVYESPDFYEACDEFGILIWQDFMFACGDYPDDDPQWLANVENELPIAYRRLRNNTCIAVWCGNNECGMNIPAGENYPGKDLYEHFLKELCETDPTRPYRISSPYDGEDVNSPDEGDMHFGAWVECARAYEPEKFSEYVTQRCTGRFHSEIHTMGSPPMRSLKRFMSEDEIANSYGDAWEYHARNNPYDGCELTYIQRMDAFARAYYGKPDSIQRSVDMLEYQHYEIINQHIEYHRRSMYDCGGVLFWCMNECWPCVCGSLVDYYMAQKAGFFAAKRGFKQTIVSIDHSGESAGVWVSNDILDGFDAIIEFAAIFFDGKKTLERSVELYVEANAALQVVEIAAEELSSLDPGKCFLMARLVRGGREIDRTIKPLGLPGEWQLPQTSLAFKCEKKSDDTFEIEISADKFARVVTIEPIGNLPTAPTDSMRLMEQCDVMDVSDNYFDLLAGELRVIRIQLRRPCCVSGFQVRAWNGESIEINIYTDNELNRSGEV